MQVTLRQAHKLVEKIGARLGTIRISPTSSISIWTQEDLVDVIRKKRDEFDAEVKRQLNLLAARQEIRMSVQACNAAEVNNLVAIRKGLLDELATWRHVQTTMNGITESCDVAGLKAQIDSSRAQPNQHTQTLYFCVMDDAQIQELDRTINKLQLRVEGIEEQLSTANSTGVIVLSANVVTLLRREGIVQ